MRLRIPFGRLALRLLPNDKPIALDRIIALRRLSIGPDALFPAEATGYTGLDLRNPRLAKLFAGREMGIWTLSPPALNYLEAAIRAAPPRCILEFGSGLSTVCLAQYMLEAHAGDASRRSPLIISIEQSANAVANTVALLTESDLGELVRVFHAPLEPSAIEGRVVNCYHIGEAATEEIAINRPDFVVIDGPFAEPGARFGTLPLVRRHLASGARFYLDDALRDGEIDAALLWRRSIDGISVEGVLPMGKGLLVGCVT